MKFVNIWIPLIIIIIIFILMVVLLINNYTMNKEKFQDLISDFIDNKDTKSLTSKEGENEKTKIPKRIIQVWKTWTSKRPEMFSSYIESIKKLNPTYEYIFFKDENMDKFLIDNYPEYYETYKKLPLNIQKMDFFRYVVLYHYGGFYFDLDIQGLEPLDELLNYNCVFPIDEIIHKNMCSASRFNNFCKNKMDFLLGQYAFACTPKNEFVKLLVDVIHKNVDNYIKTYVPNSDFYVYTTTGPDYVTGLYMNYPKKDDITILHYHKRQYFGKYGKHDYAGTWKN